MSLQTRRSAGPSRPASIVIPTLNEEHYLPHLLHSLARCTGRSLDVIVVDGCSTDATCEAVDRFRGSAPPHLAVRLLTAPVRNVSTQRNLGAAAARHETIVFLDADTIVDPPRCLDALIDGFHARRLAAAGCRFRPVERDRRAEAYYALLYVFHRLVERWDPHAMGACLVTTRTVFRHCGGFDPRLRINEDAQFCRKAACLGRFRILPVALRVSARRFVKHGYLRMGLRYLGIYLDRRLHGEAWNERIPYEHGEFS